MRMIVRPAFASCALLSFDDMSACSVNTDDITAIHAPSAVCSSGTCSGIARSTRQNSS